LEVEITSKRENLLLKRFEVKFQATHASEATPNRETMRAEIAKALSAKKEFVILDWARSDFGRTRTVGYAKIYKSKEDALKIERKPILVRMGLVAAEVKAKKEKKAPPVKVPRKEEAKPAEKTPPKEEAKPTKKEEGAKPAEKPKEEKAAHAEKSAKKAEGEKAEAKKPAKGGK
jgi:small subunit ribosomal protein S24e